MNEKRCTLSSTNNHTLLQRRCMRKCLKLLKEALEIIDGRKFRICRIRDEWINDFELLYCAFNMVTFNG
ncbi:hypothetical protein ACH3XW_40315 [Acanthocheilonema viteae]